MRSSFSETSGAGAVFVAGFFSVFATVFGAGFFVTGLEAFAVTVFFGAIGKSLILLGLPV